MIGGLHPPLKNYWGDAGGCIPPGIYAPGSKREALHLDNFIFSKNCDTHPTSYGT